LETGVFITRDPAGFVDGPNLYAYVRQNPWTAFDPEGLNETFGWDNWFANWVLPDPVASFHEGQRQAAIVGDSNAATAERIGGACGALGNGIGVVVDSIPLIGQLKKKLITTGAKAVVEKVAATEAKKLATHVAEEGAQKLENSAKKIAEKTAENAEAAAEKDLHRPKLRKGTKEAIDAKAPRAKDGRFVDEVDGVPTDHPVYGHKHGHENWREIEKAEAQGLSQKELNDRMNNPDLYQIEDKTKNGNHSREMK